jgi:alpha/beta superfamily hydrolase
VETIVDEAVGGASYAVICHPHPLYGGTMENKVVTTLARALRDAGLPTLRFNFRGVGASAGAFDQGLGETEDADAVASWGAQRWPGKTLVSAGFSFGGYVALRLALSRKAARLITVAPAIQLFEQPVVRPPDCPWLIVQGDEDDVVDPKQVAAWARSFNPAPRLVVLPGVGHFFHGRLQELHDAVIKSMPDRES